MKDTELLERLEYYKSILEKDGKDYQTTIKEIIQDREIEEDEINLFGDIFDIFNTLYFVNERMECLGARIMVACGGPTIYIDTQDKKLEIYWGNQSEELYFQDEWGLDGMVDEMWEITKMVSGGDR